MGGGGPPTDVYSTEKRSEVMRQVRGKDTGPELKVRRLLWGAGYRYRLYAGDLPGRPDLVFSGRRGALFVHGCFWHGHDCARGARAPKTNAAYWSAKIGRNRARDARVQAELEATGWRPLIVWECELKHPAATLQRLRSLLDQPVSDRSAAGRRSAQASSMAR